MRLMVAVSLALFFGAPALAQYAGYGGSSNDYGYANNRRATPQRPVQVTSAQAVCANAEKSEAQGNYIAAFYAYRQGCGVLRESRVVDSPQDTLYFRDRAGHVFPKAVAQLQKTGNTGAMTDLMRDGADLFSRLVQAHPQMANFHMRLGEIYAHWQREYDWADKQFNLALHCPDLPAAGRPYLQKELAFTKRRKEEVAAEMARIKLGPGFFDRSAPAGDFSTKYDVSTGEQRARDAGDNMAADRFRNGTTINSDSKYRY